jgi:hypothetical protein
LVSFFLRFTLFVLLPRSHLFQLISAKSSCRHIVVASCRVVWRLCVLESFSKTRRINLIGASCLPTVSAFCFVLFCFVLSCFALFVTQYFCASCSLCSCFAVFFSSQSRLSRHAITSSLLRVGSFRGFSSLSRSRSRLQQIRFRLN